MTEDQNQIQEEQQSAQHKPSAKHVEEIPPERVEQALEVLYDQGGFDFLATTVEGTENMEPGAMRNVFLGDEENEAERIELKLRLKSFVDLLDSVDNVGDMIETSQGVAEKSNTLLKTNLKKAFDATKTLEENYRTVASFFTNAGGDDPVKNLTIVNASMDKLTDLDNRRFLSAVAEEFKEKYDRLDLANNYGMLVLPGYLGSKTVLDEWARIAFDNKVMMVTDFMNLETTDQVMKLFDRAKLTGADDFRANVMMTCNWLVAREQYIESGEESPMFIPPSAALAGKMYSGNMAQVSAGVKHGVMRGVRGTRFIIHANDMAKLGDMGVIPMVFEYGQVQAMAKSTLFNGTNLGMQTYSVVRTFDWLTKCLMDFLNRKVFINISVNEEMAIQNEISRFFDKCVREYKFLEKVGKITVKRDNNEKDRVHVYVHATPFFPAKNFVLKLDGKNGDNGHDYLAKLEDS